MCRYTNRALKDMESLTPLDQRRVLDAFERFAASGVGDVYALGGQ